MKKIFLTMLGCICILFSSCTTLQKSNMGSENEDFINGEKKGKEVFRVLISSHEYKVKQFRFKKTMERVPDPGGDKYITHEIAKLNMINEVRTGVTTVWLYPDSGRILKIRSQRPTYFKEIDSLINDDIMRWNLKFPKGYVEPVRFDVVYRVVLRKEQSDDEIIRQVQNRIKEGG